MRQAFFDLYWALWSRKCSWLDRGGRDFTGAAQGRRYDDDICKVEMGGGDTPSLRENGFLNFDLRKLPEVDVVGEAWALSKVLGQSSVDYLYSRHMVEHLTFTQLNLTFRDWAVALRTGAVLEIVVPNERYHLMQLLLAKPGSRMHQHGLAGFHGWQRGASNGELWDVHKSSFSRGTLLAQLTKHLVFEKHTFICDLPKNLHFIGRVA